MKATEFAKTHRCDSEWIKAMGNREVIVLEPGQRGTTSGFPATVIRHYANGMYEVRVPGGWCCISAKDFTPTQTQTQTEEPALILHRFVNAEDGYEVHVTNHKQGYGVMLFDTESGNYFPSTQIFPSMVWACGVAQAIAEGRDYNHADSVSMGI